MAAEREKMYECEVRRRRVKVGGGYEPFWKVKNVAVAMSDSDTEFRCKDCQGEVKILGRTGKPGTVPYVELGGMVFRKATDGRESRLSERPVR
jgi:hypothetical protein